MWVGEHTPDTRTHTRARTHTQDMRIEENDEVGKLKATRELLVCECVWGCVCVCVCERERERERESLVNTTATHKTLTLEHRDTHTHKHKHIRRQPNPSPPPPHTHTFTEVDRTGGESVEGRPRAAGFSSLQL